jgi:hypothetical protein
MVTVLCLQKQRKRQPMAAINCVIILWGESLCSFAAQPEFAFASA